MVNDYVEAAKSTSFFFFSFRCREKVGEIFSRISRNQKFLNNENPHNSEANHGNTSEPSRGLTHHKQ